MSDGQDTSERPALPFAPGELEEVKSCPIGAALKAARLASRLSIDAVSARTRIRSSYLEAIEAGQLDSFVAPIYAVGFARNYARELGLDPDWADQAMRNYVASGSTTWRRSGWVS